MVIEASVVTGYVIAWVMRKARRAGKCLDTEVDAVMDAGLGKLHEVVSTKLGADPALGALDEEAAIGQVSELTRQRVELSIQAAGQDQAFVSVVSALVQQVRSHERANGPIAVGPGAAAVVGDVGIHAESDSAAAWTMGNVSLGQSPRDPR